MVLFRITENEPSKMHVRPYVYSRPWLELFTKHGRSIENMPSTQQVLIASYQSGIWVKAIGYEQRPPPPVEWGWKVGSGSLDNSSKGNYGIQRFNAMYT